MDLTDRRNPFNNLAFPPPPPMTFTSPIFPRASSSGTNFPIIAVAVIGILVTAFLLVSYYIFVIKCCLNWHQIDIFRLRRRRSSDQNPLMIYTPHEINRGLDESAIRAIPIFKFKKRDVVVGGEEEDNQNKISQECSVCLNEFQEDEKLRIIPNCCHVFHIDCIDIWLQGNANCPLCRTSVSCDASFHLHIISSPDNTHPPPNRNLEPGLVSGRDDDYVVIELGTSNGNDRQNLRNRDILAEQERATSNEVVIGNIPKSISPSPRKFDHHVMHNNDRKFHKVTSMGDECINVRCQDSHFGEIQTIRRSISMDSSVDLQLYLAVQEEISRINRQVPMAGGLAEDCSSSGGGDNRVMKRCFFSFGSSKTSKSSSILPDYLEY